MKYHTYQTVVETLMEIPTYAGKTTKENIEMLMELLGNPLQKQTILHVAGTNGKGSTCAFLDRLLRAAGYKTAMFTSPHLIDIRERIWLEGTPVTEEMFVEAFAQVNHAIQQGMQQGGKHPSFFETLFLMSAVIFQKITPDFCIYEAGLGGSRDVTNLVTPVVSIITTISLEHTEFLGDTLEQITREKAGIIKPNIPVISLNKNPKVAEVIQQVAKEKQAPCILISPGEYVTLSAQVPYQKENASLAKKAVELLGIPVSIEALEQMKWPGRMEEVLPGIFVDGAHNLEAIETLVRTLETCYSHKNKVLLFSVAEDKNYEEMIACLCEKTKFQQVILATMDNSRVCAAERLAECFRNGGQQNIEIIEKPLEAFQYGRNAIGEDGMLICTGSLYFVGELKRLLGGHDDKL